MGFQVVQTDCQRPLEAANQDSLTDLASVGHVNEIHVMPNMVAWRGRTSLCEIGSMTDMPLAPIPEAMIGPRREARTMSEIVWNRAGVARRLCLDGYHPVIDTMHRQPVIYAPQVEMRG